ncbi:MAG TPA: hypothetical protein PKD55_12675, partial [Bellilinea sp.]|nr:hypothetical protein [Bellilinea sp.]
SFWSGLASGFRWSPRWTRWSCALLSEEFSTPATPEIIPDVYVVRTDSGRGAEKAFRPESRA